MQNIPKIIHYCWFGGKPLPDEYKKYIDSWKKYCPDWEIREWNESNFDFSSCEYAMEAYDAKKWAFVSDYARFKILYEYGGVYFDTDVEILQSLDEVLKSGPFMGIEKIGSASQSNPGLGLGVAPGLGLGVAPGLGLGGAPGLGLYKEILEFYNTIHFKNLDGSYNLNTVVQYVTDILKRHGFVEEDKKQTIAGVTIYPSDYFDPMNCETGEIKITQNTVSIHHYACSWADKKTQRKKKIQKLIGPEITSIIIKIKRKIRGNHE